MPHRAGPARWCGRRWAPAALTGWLAAVPLAAQTAAPPGDGGELFEPWARTATVAPVMGAPSADADRERAANALLSLALPGAGQWRAGQRRAWAYLAVEALAWAGWAERRHRGGELRDRYRDLAWEVARLQGAPRDDPAFAYYETLTKWVRSGAFDRDAGAPGIQPETDPTTYNGSIWALARGLFLPPGSPGDEGAPGWTQAIAYYRDRAWGDAYLWDWSAHLETQREYSNVIRASDDRFRQATNLLGVVLANHLVSAADAFLSGRAAETVGSLRIHRDPTGVRGWAITGRIGRLP